MLVCLSNQWGGELLIEARLVLSKFELARSSSAARFSAVGAGSQVPIRRISIICNDTDYFLRHRRAPADDLVDSGHHVRVLTGGEPLSSGEEGGWKHVGVSKCDCGSRD